MGNDKLIHTIENEYQLCCILMEDIGKQFEFMRDVIEREDVCRSLAQSENKIILLESKIQRLKMAASRSLV